MSSFHLHRRTHRGLRLISLKPSVPDHTFEQTDSGDARLHCACVARGVCVRGISLVNMIVVRRRWTNVLDASLAYNAAEQLLSLSHLVATLTDPTIAAVPEIQTITGLLASANFNNTLLAPDDAAPCRRAWHRALDDAESLLAAQGMDAPADLAAPSTKYAVSERKGPAAQHPALPRAGPPHPTPPTPPTHTHTCVVTTMVSSSLLPPASSSLSYRWLARASSSRSSSSRMSRPCGRTPGGQGWERGGWHAPGGPLTSGPWERRSAREALTR